jgi:heptose-I-phosphate ethanolaminephosphotransferase
MRGSRAGLLRCGPNRAAGRMQGGRRPNRVQFGSTMRMTRKVIGPAFAAAALVIPNLIAVFDVLRPAGEGALAHASPPGWFAIQSALLMLGLSAAVTSCALALYHRPAPRRLLHLFLFCGLLELFYRFAYGGAVSSGILLSVPETSSRETGELLAGHAALTAGLTLVALLTVYSCAVSWRGGMRFSPKSCIKAFAIAALAVVVSLAVAAQQAGNLRSFGSVALREVQATFPFDVVSAFGGVATGLINARRMAATREEFLFPRVSLLDAAVRAGESEIYVVAIGETSRRANWSLFGYPRATTPLLDEIRSDLIVFNHVTSNATNTILSVPLALTRASPASRNAARSEKSIITLLKQAGFATFWISNQERSDALSNPISQIALEADHVSFPGNMRPAERNGGFDSNLLTRLDDELTRLPKGGKAVIFLHMEGSHFGYKERYPASFTRFRDGQGAPRTLPQRQMRLLDEYDNSVSFTDSVARAVIDRLTACGCRSGLIYFSDHGERLFDNGLSDDDFGHGFPTISRQEIEIPFFAWLSGAYRHANPDLVQRLQANASSTAQLQNLFETITDLAGVDYAARSAGSSLFSAQFRPPHGLEVLKPDEESVYLAVADLPAGAGPGL